MNYLPIRDGGVEGGAEGLEIQFQSGESTIIVFQRGRLSIDQQVEACCELNEVSMENVVSAQVISNCLYC